MSLARLCSAALLAGGCFWYLAASAPSPALAQTAPAPDPRMALVDEMLRLRAETGDAKPLMTRADYQRAVGGETVFVGKEYPGSELKVGVSAKVVQQPAWKLWRSVVDEFHHEEFMTGVSYSDVVSGKAEGRYIYQMLAAPVITTRHWIVSAHHQGELWKRSGGKVWQARFKSVPNMKVVVDKAIQEGRLPASPAGEDLSEAILVATSDASWTLLELSEDTTLAEYRAFSDPGGVIPAWVLNQAAPSTAKGLLTDIEKWAKSSGHFSGGHATLYDPLLRPMPASGPPARP